MERWKSLASGGEQSAPKVSGWIFTLRKLLLCSFTRNPPLNLMSLRLFIQLFLNELIFLLHYKDLTEKAEGGKKERKKRGKREGGREAGRGKVRAGLPDASKQVSVHTVLRCCSIPLHP